jgi:signal transduction histidine kinase/ActR/RegA family two-component response regulator
MLRFIEVYSSLRPGTANALQILAPAPAAQAGTHLVLLSHQEGAHRKDVMKTGDATRRRKVRPFEWATICAVAVVSLLVVKLGSQSDVYGLILAAPIAGIIIFAYRNYLRNIESSAAQAEQAERHVRELSHYIAEQERIREQFTQVEKLSALGELASGVAHDFNNTLAGILGRAQLLLRTNDPEKIQRGLNIIIKTAEDGAKTVKRIQDFARQRRDKDLSLLSVERLLLDVSELTKPRWKNKAQVDNVHITLDLNIESKAMIMGDESELREVLINMVFNAIDAMPQGGKITLAARNEGTSVVLSVSDTGVGMTGEVRSKIFDPFYTTKGTAGLGLGLAVSFGIIRRHGSTIDVESQTGAGTTFRIAFPVVSVAETAEPEPIEAVVEQPIAAVVDDEPKILVVDDEEFVRDLLRELIESDGCRVYTAASGEEGLALYEARHFDAVLTDVGMPGMTGWEFAQAIRKRNETVPIAVITGWGETIGSTEQHNANVDWVVSKPFTADRIAALVNEIKRLRQQGRQTSGRTIVAA